MSKKLKNEPALVKEAVEVLYTVMVVILLIAIYCRMVLVVWCLSYVVLNIVFHHRKLSQKCR